ncbi:hypothetical protein [Lysinibacillus sphaericus]|uniref:hypothetical protein n=1 Tax=Lysinibacillus sphaericus TaxID=1421 RepID=UPI003D0805AD
MTEKSSWHSVGDELVRCPVEGCCHIGIVITKAHCKIEHNMTRDEVSKKYGYPKRVRVLKESQVMGGIGKDGLKNASKTH